MPLGTMILPALITPKSSFPSLSLSPSLSCTLISQYANTHFVTHTHTHTLCHMPRPAPCTVSSCELAAGPVICVGVWLGGRREFGSISVCLHPSFILLHIFPPDMNDFHIPNVWGGLHLLHAVIWSVFFIAEFSGMNDWHNAILEGRVFFFSCTVTDWSQRDKCETGVKIYIYLCMHACSSFSMCQRLIGYCGRRWVSCSFTLWSPRSF